MRRALLALLLVGACYGAERGSIGMGAHTQGGPMMTMVYTGENGIGVFGGYANSRRTSLDIPVEGYFSHVDYSHSDWKSKEVIFGGMAFQVTNDFTVGVGYQSYAKHTYLYGTSQVTGWEWSVPGPTESRGSVVGMVDFRLASSCGVFLSFNADGVGAGLTLRF